MSRRRRRALLILAPVALALAAASACSFPDLSYSTGTIDGASTDSPGSDSPNGDDAADAIADVADRDRNADPETAPPLDATSEKPPVGNCTLHPCDCDQDEGGTMDGAAPGACMLSDASRNPNSDCDDLDNRAYRGADYSTELPTVDTKGDWNCNGTVERYYAVNLDCSVLGACSVIITKSAEGFLNDPECGVAADYFRCQNGAGGCQPVKVDNFKQACR